MSTVTEAAINLIKNNVVLIHPATWTVSRTFTALNTAWCCVVVARMLLFVKDNNAAMIWQNYDRNWLSADE